MEIDSKMSISDIVKKARNDYQLGNELFKVFSMTTSILFSDHRTIYSTRYAGYASL
jgi:hypothetical protein